MSRRDVNRLQRAGAEQDEIVTALEGALAETEHKLMRLRVELERAKRLNVELSTERNQAWKERDYFQAEMMRHRDAMLQAQSERDSARILKLAATGNETKEVESCGSKGGAA